MTMLKSFKRKKRFAKRREEREEIWNGIVEINGQAFYVTDWSARAFMAKPCVIDCEINDRVDIKFSAHLPSGPIKFDCQGIVVRIDKKNQELAANFAMLDDEAEIAITEHFGDDSKQRIAARARLVEEAREAEVARLAEEKRKVEEARLAEQKRKVEEARLAEEDEAQGRGSAPR